MRARDCGHQSCLDRLESALSRRMSEMLQPTRPGEEMSTVHSSAGEFRIPKRLADAEVALGHAMRCSKQ